MKLDLTSKYILAIVGIVALVGIVVMIMNSAGDFSNDKIGQVTVVAKTSSGVPSTISSGPIQNNEGADDKSHKGWTD